MSRQVFINMGLIIFIIIAAGFYFLFRSDERDVM